MLQRGQLLLNNERNHAERIAIVTHERTLSYGELNKESNCVANALKRLGIRKEDRVAFLMKNSTEWIVAWFACQKIGAVCVPLHVRLRSEELLKCMDSADCIAIIYHEQYEDNVLNIVMNYQRLKTRICVGTSDMEDSVTWESLYLDADDTEAQEKLSDDAPSVLLFTSGTTGEPKGVLRTQKMVMLHAITLAIRNKSPHRTDVMLSTAPLFHIGGLQAMIKMLLLGGTFISLNSIEPSEILRVIETQRVTQLQMLPPITYERLYSRYKSENRDLSSVWEVCISAGKCTLEYTNHIFEMFPNCHLRPSWGSTETCSVTCMQITKEALQKDHGLINAVGTIMPFNQVKIVDKRGQEVVPGEAGEALVRSPMVFEGYVYRGKVSCCEDVFTEDGWYKTGDIIRIEPTTGICYFLDRIKDVIKTGGESVFALEIERVIEKHPAVFECAAIGIDDERFGEGIGVAIVLNQGWRLEGKALVEFCMEHMAGYKKPRYIAVLDKLPINTTGKIAKGELKQKYKYLFQKI